MRTTSKMAVSRLLTRVAVRIAQFWEAYATVAASLVTQAQKDLVKAERTLEAARGRVSVTAEHLSATQSVSHRP